MGWRTKLSLGVLALALLSFLTIGACDAVDPARFNAMAEPTQTEVLRFVGDANESRSGGKGNFAHNFPS